MSVLFRNQYLAVSRANRTYDFLHYNTGTHLWEKIAPPNIQGIYVNYADHPIAEVNTHVTLVVGRKRVRIGIHITRDILKQTLDANWICIVTLRDGKTFQNPFERLQRRDIPILTTLEGRVNVGIRVMNEQPIPENDDPPALTIPRNVPAEYHTMYGTMYNLIVPLWYDTSRDPNSDQNPNVVANRVMTRTIEFGATIVNQINAKRILPKHIAELIAKDAVVREEICPITMDAITMETCAVTSCFHVFERDALAMWHVTNNTCPVCKQGCSVAVIRD